MDELDQWLYLDGPEPEQVSTLLAAFRDLPPVTPADTARMARAFFASLDADLAPEAGAGGGEGADAVVSPEPAPAPRPRPLVLEPDDEDDGEGAAPEPPPRVSEAPPPPLASAPESVPATRVPSALAGTALALDVPAELRTEQPVLPFLPPERVPAERRSVRTMPVPVMRVPGRETAPLGDDAMEKALAALPWPRSRGAEPRAAPATPPVPIPTLTLTQYASLCAELAERPDQAATILLRYQVSSTEAHAALQRHWREQLAVSPETRAAFEKACGEYAAWLRMRRG